MWNYSFNSCIVTGSKIMVIKEENKDNDFEELVSKASIKARELNFKKLVLKSLRVDIEGKDPGEIESLYYLYKMTLYNDC